jgi:hypothetical protein
VNDDAELPDWTTIRHDLFISFSFADMSSAATVDAALRPEFEVFFAPRCLPPERQAEARFQFASLLMDALARSAHVLALLSPRYLDSAWCQLEMIGFANLHRADRERRLWLHALEPCGARVPAALRSLLQPGPLDATIETVRRRVRASTRRRGFDFGGMPPAPLPRLPLHALYPMPRRAPWKPDGRSRGHPAGPPYAVYEALVREYMVQLLRRNDPDPFSMDEPWLEVPMDGLDPRLRSLTRRALEDARELLRPRRVSPFHTRRPYREMCIELMLQAGASGETPWLLRAMAECRAHMGPASRAEALSLAARALQAGEDAAALRRWRALAHYLGGALAEAVAAYEGVGPADLHAPDWKLLAAAHARLGETAAASAAMARVRALEPGFDLAEEALQSMLEDDGDLDYWIDGLRLAQA